MINFYLHQFLLYTAIVFPIMTTLPKILEYHEFSYFFIGIILAFFQFGSTCLMFLFTKFSFKGEYLKYVYFSLSLSIVLFYFFIENHYLSVLFAFIIALSYLLGMGYNDMMIVEKYKEKQGRVRALGSFFFVIIAISSYYLNVDEIFIFNFLVVGSIFLFINSLQLKKLSAYQKNILIKKEHFFNELMLYTHFFVFFIGIGMFASFYTLIMLQNGHSLADTFLFFATFIGGEVIGLYFFDRVLNFSRFFTIKNIIWFSLLMTIFRFLFMDLYITSFYWQLLLNLLHLFTFAFMYSSIVVYFNLKYTNNHFNYMKLYSGIGWGLGGSFGTLLGALLMGFGYTHILFLCSIIIFVSAFPLFLHDFNFENKTLK
jgi:MFS family permease